MAQSGTGDGAVLEAQSIFVETQITEVVIETQAPATSSSPVSGPSAQQLVLVAGAYVLPHPDKIDKGGEDWFFVSDSMRAMGVADGVGGWAEVGVDAGAYARQLMGAAKDNADLTTAVTNTAFQRLCQGVAMSTVASEPMEEVNTDTGTQQLQQAILEQAHSSTDVQGSCTACVLVLAGDRLLASNLGDSGFLVLRNGKVAFHCPQQQHQFNFPFQIGSPDSMSDLPQVAQRFELVVRPGDVVVVGTDGLWDNCFDEEVTSVIKYCHDANMDMPRTAQVLAHYARHRAADPKFASPFAYGAYEAGFAFMGGKMDDITVLVARITLASDVEGSPLPGQGGKDLTMPGQAEGSGVPYGTITSKL